MTELYASLASGDLRFATLMTSRMASGERTLALIQMMLGQREDQIDKVESPNLSINDIKGLLLQCMLLARIPFGAP